MGHRRPALALVALLVCGARCSDPRQPEAPPAVDAGTREDCQAACDKLAALGCPEAAPTPDGGSCVDVCWNAESSGYLTISPGCVAAASSCDAVNACYQP